MPEYDIPFGRGSMSFSLPDNLQAQVVSVANAPPAKDQEATVAQALEAPVGGVKLDQASGSPQVRSAAIAINDKTRPVPNALLLPPLLKQLHSMGLARDDVRFLVAKGTHPPMSEDDLADVAPEEIRREYRFLAHDCDADEDLVSRGRTSRDTPVWINRHFAEADLRIVIGTIEPHQFAGFSGGVKTAVIGLGGRETIDRNHALLTDPACEIGKYDGHPMRSEMEEMGQAVGVHFALNVILNDKGEIVRALAGRPSDVMRAGIPLLRELRRFRVQAKFDLVIASPGGHPKDINVIQAQKAVGHARLITKPGGAIIVAAACPEGSGNKGHESWVRQMAGQGHEAVVERFKSEPFRIGPHKAYQISRDSLVFRMVWVSNMTADYCRELMLEPATDIDEALERLNGAIRPDARIGIMPKATATIPCLESSCSVLC